MTVRMLSFFILFSTVFYAQTDDPYKIIEDIKTKYNSLNDYEVNAKIKIDVNFLKVPESKAIVYFKKPDKIKLRSEGFALLPKEGLNFLPEKFLKGDITAIFIKRDTLRADSAAILKIIPNSDSSDVVLSKLWIDTELKVIRKVETTTKERGTFTVDLFYGTEKEFGLPDSVKLSFNISNVPSPGTMMTDRSERNSSKRRKRFSGPMVGSVTVYYSSYKVNVGLSDELFEEESDKDK